MSETTDIPERSDKYPHAAKHYRFLTTYAKEAGLPFDFFCRKRQNDAVGCPLVEMGAHARYTRGVLACLVEIEQLIDSVLEKCTEQDVIKRARQPGSEETACFVADACEAINNVIEYARKAKNRAQVLTRTIFGQEQMPESGSNDGVLFVGREIITGAHQELDKLILKLSEVRSEIQNTRSKQDALLTQTKLFEDVISNLETVHGDLKDCAYFFQVALMHDVQGEVFSFRGYGTLANETKGQAKVRHTERFEKKVAEELQLSISEIHHAFARNRSATAGKGGR